MKPKSKKQLSLLSRNAKRIINELNDTSLLDVNKISLEFRLEYIEDMASQLSSMSAESHQPFLSYLLNMAAQEAQLARARSCRQL